MAEAVSNLGVSEGSATYNESLRQIGKQDKSGNTIGISYFWEKLVPPEVSVFAIDGIGPGLGMSIGNEMFTKLVMPKNGVSRVETTDIPVEKLGEEAS
jgi:hypothetical protein